MSDEQNPRSGSRWEPGPEDETVAQPSTAPEPPPAATAVTAPATTPVAKRGWTQRVRGNGGLIGAAIALVLVSGIGGFAIGHATAGPDRFGLVGERFPGGPGGDFPGRPHADGVPPGFPDHDRDGFGTPPRTGDDSTVPDDSGSDDSGSDDGGSTDEQSGSTL